MEQKEDKNPSPPYTDSKTAKENETDSSNLNSAPTNTPTLILPTDDLKEKQENSNTSDSNASVGAPKKSPKKQLLVISGSLILLLIIVSTLYLAFFKHKASTTINLNTTGRVSIPNKEALSRASSNLPPVQAQASEQQVSIKYVTIPTGVAEDQNSEGDYAATASGHFAYIDGSQDGQVDEATGGKVIYDGQVVSQGAQIVQDNIIISQNGLHYGYLTDDGTNYTIYIDNKAVAQLSDSNTLTLDGVSNDGQHYTYDYEDQSGNDVLFKDGDNLYTTNGSLSTQVLGYNTALFDSNLSNYVGVLQSSPEATSGQILYDGNLTNQSFNGGQYDIGISENGKHYYVAESNSVNTTPSTQTEPCEQTTSETTPNEPAQTCSKTQSTTSQPKTTDQLVVDGKVVNSLDGLDVAGVNDSGDYFYINNSSHSFIIDGTYKYSLSANDFNASELDYEFAVVNSNASHYVVGNSDTGYWEIDGKKVAITGDVFNIELDSNILYVYNWSN